jgi:predicted extracellular nuclease
VVVHLKSKRGDEAENSPRRVQQARHTAALLGDQAQTGQLAIALGDFNDDLGSEPLGEFRGFVNLYERHTPPADHYSYIYNGRAQAIDHIIMTAAMDAYYLGGGAVHVNADYAEPLPGSQGRTSDHDPLVSRFRFEPTGISAALLGAASGAAGYHQPLRLK